METEQNPLGVEGDDDAVSLETEQTNAPDEAGGKTQDDGMVEIEEAADDDIEAFLRGDHLKSEEPESAATKQPEEQTEPAQKPEDKGEQQTKARPGQTLEQQLQSLQEEHKRTLAQLEQQETFIQRRNNEVGELRKQLTQSKGQLEQALGEKWVENPAEALKDAQKIQELDKEIKDLDQNMSTVQTIHERQKTFLNHINPGAVDFGEMVRCLQDDGIDAQYIEGFKQNPYLVADGAELIHLAKRAQGRTALRELVKTVRTLQNQIKALKGKPNEVLKKVQNAAKVSPQVTAAKGSANGKTNNSFNPALMSDAEIDEFLKENT